MDPIGRRRLPKKEPVVSLPRGIVVDLAPVRNALVEKSLLIAATSLCAACGRIAGLSRGKLLYHQRAALSRYFGGDGPPGICRR